MSEKLHSQSSSENPAAKEWEITVLQPEKPEIPNMPAILHDTDIMLAMEKHNSQLTDEERESIHKYEVAESIHSKRMKDYRRDSENYESGAYASGPRGLVTHLYRLDEWGRRIDDSQANEK